MLVLCSDGVHKHVEPTDLTRVLRQSAPLVRRCGKLVALARARGSTDDATVLGPEADRTQRMDLMTMVTCPFLRYHPAVVAQGHSS